MLESAMSVTPLVQNSGEVLGISRYTGKHVEMRIIALCKNGKITERKFITNSIRVPAVLSGDGLLIMALFCWTRHAAGPAVRLRPARGPMIMVAVEAGATMTAITMVSRMI